MDQLGGCANPLLLTFLTLGVIPGVVYDGYLFHYDLETDGFLAQKTHRLPVYSRVSIWEWFLAGSHREGKVLAEALAWSPAEKRPLM
jgi:hypothetical protein